MLDHGAISTLLDNAAHGVTKRLESKGLLAEGVGVKLKTRKFEVLTRQGSFELGQMTQRSSSLRPSNYSALPDR